MVKVTWRPTWNAEAEGRASLSMDDRSRLLTVLDAADDLAAAVTALEGTPVEYGPAVKIANALKVYNLLVSQQGG